MVYNRFSDYMKEKYGEKVYKLPIKLPGTCPNRDGKVGYGGCAFCNEKGGSFENLDFRIPVKEQLKINKDYISKRYGAKKFIAYFQNYTNTYMELELFKNAIYDVIEKDIVAIYISTRPDCVSNIQLDFLKEINEKYNIDIVFELGLQTVNYKSLIHMNRGHSLAEFIDSVLRIHSYNFEICTHMIIGLPLDDRIDVIEGAKIISSLNIKQIKLHALYLLKDTKYGNMYINNEFDLISLEEYKERVILFLRYLSPDIIVQRIIGRSDKEDSLFSNWGTSWWKIHDDIIETMEKEGFVQGDLYDYLEPIRKGE